jgi:hypothetical protein
VRSLEQNPQAASGAKKIALGSETTKKTETFEHSGDTYAHSNKISFNSGRAQAIVVLYNGQPVLSDLLRLA